MEEKVIFLSPSAQEYNVGYGDFGTEENEDFGEEQTELNKSLFVIKLFALVLWLTS